MIHSSTVARALGTRSVVYIKDLRRPVSEEEVHALKDRYLRDAPDASCNGIMSLLHAAFTLEEVGEQLVHAGLADQLSVASADDHTSRSGVTCSRSWPDDKSFVQLNPELQALAGAVDRRRNFDQPTLNAGATTLTEKLLFMGAIQHAEAVKARGEQRKVTSDWMELEKQRGISITSTVLQFDYGTNTINLLDTPGHQDFSEDTYRIPLRITL